MPNFAILSREGSRVGELSAMLQSASASENLNHRFKSLPGGFRFFLRQIPSDEVFPIAEFCDLSINPNERRRGYGREAMRAFHVLALGWGAKSAFLRVATQGEDYESGVEWRRAFYRSEGWQDFERPPDSPYAPHCMFHLLDSAGPLSRNVSSILRELDDMEEWFRVQAASRQAYFESK